MFFVVRGVLCSIPVTLATSSIFTTCQTCSTAKTGIAAILE